MRGPVKGAPEIGAGEKARRRPIGGRKPRWGQRGRFILLKAASVTAARPAPSPTPGFHWFRVIAGEPRSPKIPPGSAASPAASGAEKAADSSGAWAAAGRPRRTAVSLSRGRTRSSENILGDGRSDSQAALLIRLLAVGRSASRLFSEAAFPGRKDRRGGCLARLDLDRGKAVGSGESRRQPDQRLRFLLGLKCQLDWRDIFAT